MAVAFGVFAIKYYLMEMLEPTLLYGLSLAVLGICAAIYYGHFSLFYALLALTGSVLAQMSVNVISDYIDYSSGLDKELARNKSTQLSGGSSLLAEGRINPQYTLGLGLGIFAIAAVIGIYLLHIRIQLLPILVIAALSILLYAKYVKRVPYLSEPLCALNYILISVGNFIVISGAYVLSYNLAFSFIPAGIVLGLNTLFVNEVPDKAVDKKYGAKHSAVMLGSSRNIGLYYLALQAIAYAMVAIGILIGALPRIFAISLFTMLSTPFVFMTLYNAESRKYAARLKMHTLWAFAFGLLLSASYLLSAA